MDARQRWVAAMVAAGAFLSGPAGAQRSWHPTITANAPSLVQHGANITITGTDLNPPGVAFGRTHVTPAAQVHRANTSTGRVRDRGGLLPFRHLA